MPSLDDRYWFTHAMPFPCLGLKADLHIPCRSHAVPMPFPCRSHAVPLPCLFAKALDCVFPIWFTQCGRVWFTHAMPFPCRSHAVPLPCHEYAFKKATSQGHGRFMAQSRRHVRDLPVYGLLPQPHAVPGSLLSEAYQSQITGGQCETEQRLWWKKRSLLF
jgi:hypothetical protein